MYLNTSIIRDFFCVRERTVDLILMNLESIEPKCLEPSNFFLLGEGELLELISTSVSKKFMLILLGHYYYYYYFIFPKLGFIIDKEERSTQNVMTKGGAQTPVQHRGFVIRSQEKNF